MRHQFCYLSAVQLLTPQTGIKAMISLPLFSMRLQNNWVSTRQGQIWQNGRLMKEKWTGMKWTALGSFCGLILCPSGICSYELKPPRLWKQIKLSLQWKSLMSANSVFCCVYAIKCLMSLWDYYQNGTVSWKVRRLLSVMHSCGMLLSPISVLLSDRDAWNMNYRFSY